VYFHSDYVFVVVTLLIFPPIYKTNYIAVLTNDILLWKIMTSTKFCWNARSTFNKTARDKSKFHKLLHK